MTIPSIEVHGHRGCRGLMPENTIPSFIHAIDLGVDVVELDVVISKDNKVVVSHEPYFNHVISLQPNGDTIKEAESKNIILYTMNYDSINKYDVGQRGNVKFPLQKKISAVKPLLMDVFDACEKHVQQKKLKPIKYNIEIKSNKEEIGITQPSHEKFVSLVMDVIKGSKVEEKVNIQSFDHDIIIEVHKKYPNMELAILVGDTISSEHHIQRLGFIPNIYSPHFSLINEDLIKYCKTKSMKVIPWTINDSNEVERIMKLGVDGIITDYPDMALEVRVLVQDNIK